jgi:hypothetical protein
MGAEARIMMNILREFAWKALGTLLILFGMCAVVATIVSLRTSILLGAMASAAACSLLAGGGILRSWSNELRCVRKSRAATEHGGKARLRASGEASGMLRLAYSHGHDRSVNDHSLLFEHLASEHDFVSRSMTTHELRTTHEQDHATSPHRWLADLTGERPLIPPALAG